MTKHVEVAAAILLRNTADGVEYLLAQRPSGKVYAGYWEFPGGKVEPGETLREALVRELHEELGITIDQAWPWLSCEFTYPHADVRLKFFRVTSWRGEIAPIEHSGFVWTKIGHETSVSPVLPANGPILRALELPPVYAITNAAQFGIEAELTRVEKAMAAGVRLVQVRDKTLSAPDRLRLAQGVMDIADRFEHASILINDDEELARRVGARGLHLSSARLKCLTERPEFNWVAASCHTEEDLARAISLGIDFVVLSPVLPTESHPAAKELGWDVFARVVERSSLPVFALGGMTNATLDIAREHGGHGVALLRGW